MEDINMMFAVLKNSDSFFGPRADKLISLCKQDIEMAQEYKMCEVKCYPESSTGYYESFKRLAMIYESRKEYDKAIQVCIQAIKLGFDNDGNKSKMQGRLAKLLRLGGYKNNSSEYLFLKESGG